MRYIGGGGQEEEIICFQHTSHIGIGYESVMLPSYDGLDIVGSCLSGDERGMNCAMLGTIVSRTTARSTVAETVACVPSQDGLDIVSSCLSGDKRGMKRAMLEVVATKAVTSAQDVQRYIKCTLLAATMDFQVGSLMSHLCIAPACANTAPHTDTVCCCPGHHVASHAALFAHQCTN